MKYSRSNARAKTCAPWGVHMLSRRQPSRALLTSFRCAQWTPNHYNMFRTVISGSTRVWAVWGGRSTVCEQVKVTPRKLGAPACTTYTQKTEHEHHHEHRTDAKRSQTLATMNSVAFDVLRSLVWPLGKGWLRCEQVAQETGKILVHHPVHAVLSVFLLLMWMCIRSAEAPVPKR